ncbi:hypothetical protein [Paraburkholderia sp. SIMBA_054]|uniref:hypothetical protein n=1 Tax=Paraburkholderia sp. SIMBA_054 TaxID=3085795 RepID=UPI00397D8E2A
MAHIIICALSARKDCRQMLLRSFSVVARRRAACCIPRARQLELEPAVRSAFKSPAIKRVRAHRFIPASSGQRLKNARQRPHPLRFLTPERATRRDTMNQQQGANIVLEGQKEQRATVAVKIAFDHVKRLYPQVTRVAFDADQRWTYDNSAGDAPEFNGDVDVGLLEDAVDSLTTFPVTFTMDQIGMLGKDLLYKVVELLEKRWKTGGSPACAVELLLWEVDSLRAGTFNGSSSVANLLLEATDLLDSWTEHQSRRWPASQDEIHVKREARAFVALENAGEQQLTAPVPATAAIGLTVREVLHLPSADGHGEYDRFALAPAGMTSESARDRVNSEIARANREAAAGENGTCLDGKCVEDSLKAVLENEGFTFVKPTMTRCWDEHQG